ncbi:MAG TPA: hypothetical protein VKR29_12235 [Candidatus Binataceae bacterium]|nr:hypothetical protein [Candidatus Binataceae bacterium]
MKKSNRVGGAYREVTAKPQNVAVHQALKRIVKAAEEINREIDALRAIARTR